MKQDIPAFSEIFKALTGFAPLHWQKRLFNDYFLPGNLPNVCDLPTGLGKTSVIPIWLIALASQFSTGQKLSMPRRLVYVVNRRTVVDQASAICDVLRTKIESTFSNEMSEIKWMCDALSKMRATLEGPVMAISTLRGELADNEEWKTDPSRPAIIVGTVDMIGSKLLFKGYGDSYKTRPHHAGLIGQDTLFIHDEAHLTPAFGELLRSIAREQQRCNEPKPIRVLELSATTQTKSNTQVFDLTEDDKKDDIVDERINSQKQLQLHSKQDKAKVLEQIVDLALAHQNSKCKVLIYVSAPKDARKIVSLLKQQITTDASNRVALLTGTMRGFERNRLVKENDVYQAMLDSGATVPETVFLVSTSAGEVGIDLDADHLICDLSTLDSMIQRLGRVNRRGGKNRVAKIDVVFVIPAKEAQQGSDRLELARFKTLEALKKLPDYPEQGYDARPIHLRDLLSNSSNAVLPPPAILPLNEILFDAWALTSGRHGLINAPEVEPFLHGLEKEKPETYVAWRTEVSLLAKANVNGEALQDWFKHCRIESQEQLREPTYQIFEELKKISQRCGNKLVVLLASNGEAELLTLRDLEYAGFSKLAYATVVLPTEVGGLSSEGLLDGKFDNPDVADVAEASQKRERRILRRDGDSYRDWSLGGSDQVSSTDLKNTFQSPEHAASAVARPKKWSLAQKILISGEESEDEDGDTQKFLLLLVEPKRAALENPDSTRYSHQPTVDEHCELAEQWAKRFASALTLEPEQHEAVAIAARWHDRGKDRKLWQSSIYNYGSVSYAKSGSKGMDGRLLGGYRHELGSLLEAMNSDEISQHPERDLILHLIAVHHGWARPHFLPNAHDVQFATVTNEHVIHEAMRRFGRLQLRFGRWGLAWLECLIRCSDVLSSHQISAQDNNGAANEEMIQ